MATHGDDPVFPPLLAREEELEKLSSAWNACVNGQSQLALVWGRRRVGKTFLVARFAAARRAVFYGATQQSERVELRRLLQAVGRDLGPADHDLAGGQFLDWEAALRYLARLSYDQPLLVVLDEVPYLARSTPGFASIVQVVWDHLDPRSRLMLVLTGSAIGFMEEALGGGGALMGRPTLRLHMQPVSLAGSASFLPRLSPTQLIEAYSACGGYPLHLQAWDEEQDTAANLGRLAGRAGGMLRESAEGILAEELSPQGGYPQILAAVGRGATRYSEIANRAGQRIDRALDVLLRAGFVARQLPVGAPKGANPTYAIPDPYLRFWFDVLYADLALIDAGLGDAVLRRAQSRWTRHVAGVFEDAARQHVRSLVTAGRFPEDVVVGRWWSSSGPSVEIDVLGLQGNRAVIVGEAKWRPSKLGWSEVNRLQSALHMLPYPTDGCQIALWGINGVEDAVTNAGILGFEAADVIGR